MTPGNGSQNDGGRDDGDEGQAHDHEEHQDQADGNQAGGRHRHRVEYVDDPHAPAPNTIRAGASVVVTDDHGRVLLHKRPDNGLWSIPGGGMEPGESITETAIREAEEETGIRVELVRLVGIYSKPNRVIAYPNGEVRQQFSICFTGRPVGGQLTTGEESEEVGWFAPGQIDGMPMSPVVHRRIQDALAEHSRPVIA